MNLPKKKLLFVCTINRMRSVTAQQVYGQDTRFEVRSAGTDRSAQTCLSEELLAWADAIVVMEKHHRAAIRERYPQVYNTKRIVCLYIPDEYDFMQSELIAVLKERVEDVYRKGLLG